MAGRYRLTRRIGRGGMGTVWLARDETLERDVAIKQIGSGLLGPTGLDDSIDTGRERAIREGRVAARLVHPNAVGIFDVALDDGDPWLVMEYVPGRTLHDIVQRSGVLPPERVALLGSQIGSALAEAHRVGILHRDVKPANILLTESGEAKIVDFGIAKGGDDPTLTRTGLVAGTPAYLAPEVARGDSPVQASDVWALGACLYFALEGAPPFGTDSNPFALLARIANGTVPLPRRAGALAVPLMRLLASDPWERPDMSRARSLLAPYSRGAEPMPVPRIELEGTALDEVDEPDGPGSVEAPMADPTTRAELEDAAEATPEPAPAASPAGSDPEQVAAAGPIEPTGSASTERRRRALVGGVAVLVVLAIVGLGGFLVFGPDSGSPVEEAAGAGSTETPGVEAGLGADPKESPEEPSDPPPTAEATAEPTEEPKRSADPKPVEMRPGPMRAAVADYYAIMPRDPGTGWELLGPRLREQGFDSYRGFWSTIETADVEDLSADPGGRTVQATVRFFTVDGRRSVERHEFGLVRAGNGSRLLIDTDRLLR